MRFARALTVTALAFGVAASAPAAHADPVDPVDEIESCQFSKARYSPSTVVVGLSRSIVVKVSATATRCEAYPEGAPLGDHSGYIAPSKGDPTHWVGTAEVNPYSLSNSDAGTWTGSVDLTNDGVDFPDVDLGADLTVLRASRLDADAPGTVKKNQSFRVDGFLERADWDEGEYASVDNWPVRVESKPSGGKWTNLKTVTSGRGRQGGFLAVNTKITKETCFRFVYEGTGKVAAVTSGSECVKIKR